MHVTTIKYQQSLLVLFGFTSEGVLDEWGVATNGLVTKALHFCHKMASAGKSGKVALLAGSVAAGAAATAAAGGCWRLVAAADGGAAAAAGPLS